MRLRRLLVENFRGIKSLEWSLSSRLVCLIGPGDSRKSTVLHAIDYVLGERWSLPLTDADFFDCDISNPIVVEATFTDLPGTLTQQDQYGHWLRGIGPDDALHDEPEVDDEPALSVRLTVDESLEPVWSVVKDALADHEMRVSAKTRGAMGVFLVDDAAGTHLRWARGSALNHLSDSDEVATMLTHARRKAREAVFDSPAESLQQGATRAGEAARQLGGSAFGNPRPGLDPTSGGRGPGLVLHDGHVPATQLGSGSQRLTSLAFQLNAAGEQSLVLVDELELGLEPHRLMHLLRKLRQRADAGRGQVIFTTHSPLIIEAVKVDELHISRCDGGITTITAVPSQLDDFKTGEPQATARGGPSAMLARRVVVCEGKTELGVCRRLTRLWDDLYDVPLALVGTAFRLGAGNQAPVKARCLAELGYDVALLVDNDLTGPSKAGFDTDLVAAQGAGVAVLQWATGYAVEDQIAAALPITGIQEMVHLAAAVSAKDDPLASIVDSVKGELPPGTVLSGTDVTAWMTQSGINLPELRVAIGRAAHKANWFKNEDRGEALGDVLVAHLDEIDPTDPLLVTLDALRRFALNESEAVAPSGAEEASPAE